MDKEEIKMHFMAGFHYARMCNSDYSDEECLFNYLKQIAPPNLSAVTVKRATSETAPHTVPHTTPKSSMG
jgi:hypothetical protein